MKYLTTIIIYTIPLAFILLGNTACTNINQTKLRYERSTEFASADKGPNKETVTVVAKLPKNHTAQSVELRIDEDQEKGEGKATEPEGGGIVLLVNKLESETNPEVAEIIADRDKAVTRGLSDTAKAAIEVIPKN